MPTRPRHLDRPLRRLAAAAALALAAATSAFAQPVRTPNVEAELVPATTAGVPGKPVTVALRLAMREGWHTYWRNPGDTGLPTTIEWKLPDSVTAGQIDWPAPHALPIGPLVNYGYEGEIFLPSALAIPENAKPGSTLAIAARVDWLVCKETCIPEGADLTLALPVATAAEAHPRWGAPIAATSAALPKPLAGWTVAAQGEGQRIKLTLAPPEGAADPGELRFFPNDEGRIEASSPQVATKEGAAHVLSLPVAYQLVPGFTRVAGVVTGTNGFAGAKAATIDVPLAGSVVAGPKPIDTAAAALPSAPAVSTMSLALAALFAFGGGLILNLMPCVLPVLSIKVLGFAQHHDSRATMRREGLAYGAGVLVTFIALALLLLALRAAGEELGWGFQLQSPIFVTLLAVLFFALGLNLSGVYEFGQFAPASVRGWTAKNRTLDAFSTGILAVVIASPCTAPFMGAALGFALGQPAVQTLAVFVALARIRFPAHRAAGRTASLRESWAEGLRYVARFAPARALLLIAAVVSFTVMPYASLMPVHAKDVLAGGPRTLGWLLSAAGAGALASTLYLARRESVVGLGRVIVGAAIAAGLALAAFGQVRALPLALALMVVAGGGVILAAAASNTILQTVVSDDLRGRVAGFYTLAFLGVAPLGNLAAGALAQYAGAPTTFLVNGLACAAAGTWFLRQLPALRAAIRPVYVKLGLVPADE